MAKSIENLVTFRHWFFKTLVSVSIRKLNIFLNVNLVILIKEAPN